MAWITARRAEGHPATELAAELGIAPGTVLRWSNGRSRALVPVRVVPDAVTATVVIVSPSGFRIEGLTLDDAIRVLRELG